MKRGMGIDILINEKRDACRSKERGAKSKEHTVSLLGVLI